MDYTNSTLKGDNVDTMKALGAIVGLLDGIWYRVIGGIAVDGHVGRITRSHDDVDIVVLEEELDEVLAVLRKNSYSFSLLPYKIHASIDGVPVDVAILERSHGLFWPVSFSEYKWPVYLMQGEEVTLEGIKFFVPSKEFLLAMKLEDRRQKDVCDRELLEQAGANIETARQYELPYSKIQAQLAKVHPVKSHHA